MSLTEPYAHHFGTQSRGRRDPGPDSGPVHLVQTLEDVARLDLPVETPAAYVTRTTLSVDEAHTIIAALEQLFTNIVGPDTEDICYATQNRQAAVRELTKLVDVVLVVGAKSSSNSQPAHGNPCGVGNPELFDCGRPGT
jgi:4-hydroxy-3-methylbut-2-en-1-yl diphosphate reductase